MKHSEYASSLRKIADWFEQHPEVPLPHDCDVFQYFAAHSKEDMAVLAKALGRCDKVIGEWGWDFRLERQFGAIKFQAICNRDQVCKQVQVGTKHVDEVRRPETLIPAEIIPAHDEPVYQWRCDGVLLEKEAVDVSKR